MGIVTLPKLAGADWSRKNLRGAEFKFSSGVFYQVAVFKAPERGKRDVRIPEEKPDGYFVAERK